MTAPRVPIETLLTRATWLRSLALELVGDPHRADDLVQETWVRALERPPRAGGSPSAWLARVMRNIARQDWRSAASRDARERERGAADAADAAQDVVARAQGQRKLVEAVLELDERYGAVLLMRYFDELDTSAIAERLGITPSAVRTRQQRGLELLRERIDARHGEDARQWLSAIAFAGLPGREVATLSGRTWLALAAATFVVAPIAWLAWSASSGRGAAEPKQLTAGGRGNQSAALVGTGEESGRRTALDGERAPSAARPEAGADVGAGGAPAAAVRSEAGETFVTVRIDGAPATSGTAFLSMAGWVDEDPSSVDAALRAPVEAHGQARFEDVEGRVTVIAAQLPTGGVLQKAIHGSTDEFVLELGTARVDGIVWDAEGQPARGVRLMLGMKIGWDYGALTALRTTDARGRFSVEHLPAADFWVHAELPGAASTRVHGELARGESREIVLGAPAGLVTLSGHVRTGRGAPHVGHAPYAAGTLAFVRTDASERTVFPVELAPGGSYATTLAPGRYEVNVGLHNSRGLALGPIDVTASGELDLVLPGARVSGRASVLAQGRRFDPGLDGDCVLQLTQRVAGKSRAIAAAVGADGFFAFDAVEPGAWTLSGERLAESAPLEVLVVGEQDVTIDVLVEPQ